jgi:hypothetical protein
LSAKINAVVDQAGMPVRIVLSLGQSSDKTARNFFAAVLIAATRLGAGFDHDLKRAAKKWMPVFRKSRAFSGTPEPLAIQSNRNWL